MKALFINALAAAAFYTAPLAAAHENTLTEAEASEGWTLLFDGKDLGQWRNFKEPGLSEKWQPLNGEMVLVEGGGGDVLTRKKYRNFDLRLEWKIAEAGNSGIFLLADETGSRIYSKAIEVQILDNERHPDNKLASHLSGSLYDLVPSPPASHKPAGEWNQIRIRFNDRHLKVWQNGTLTADILVGSDEWQAMVGNSKFRSWEGFAEAGSGHIGLQDHGDRVAFRNIKIKEL